MPCDIDPPLSTRGMRCRYRDGRQIQHRLPTYFVANDLDDSELREVLRASAALPGLYNRRVKFRHKRYIDGGFVDSLPILRLSMLGCRRIVTIATSPLEYSVTLDSLPRRMALRTLAIGQGRLVRQWIGTPNPLHDINLEALIASKDDPGRLGILPIAPSRRLPDVTRDMGELDAMATEGKETARRALSRVRWFD